MTLARELHPDKNLSNTEEATGRFKQLSEAYGVLGDENKRRAYDENIKYEEQRTNVETYDEMMKRFREELEDIRKRLEKNSQRAEEFRERLEEWLKKLEEHISLLLDIVI